MNVAGNLVLLVSYPKSGNTWVRIMLHGLLSAGMDSRQPDINALDMTFHAANRSLVELVSSCSSSDLTPIELDELRAPGLRALSDRTPGLGFVKVHDAYRVSAAGVALFPEDVCRAAIYIIRNPLDVVVSFAAHLGLDIEETIVKMESDFCLSGDTSVVAPQLRQRLGTWSENVESWLSQELIPVKVIRYEDLAADAETSLRCLASSVGLQVEPSAIRSAVEASSFERLQAMERETGFREKPLSQSGLFFRSGRSGGWRGLLTDQQVERVIKVHGECMAKYGYLDCL